MDKNTERELSKVSQSIPQELVDKLIVDEVDADEEEFARFALRKGNLSQSERNNISKLIEKGAFRRSEKVVNEKVAAEIDRINAAKVADLIRRGKIPDPKKDKFIQERLARQRSRR